MLATGKELSGSPGLNALPKPAILPLSWAPLTDFQWAGGCPGKAKPDTQWVPTVSKTKLQEQAAVF